MAFSLLASTSGSTFALCSSSLGVKSLSLGCQTFTPPSSRLWVGITDLASWASFKCTSRLERFRISTPNLFSCPYQSDFVQDRHFPSCSKLDGFHLWSAQRVTRKLLIRSLDQRLIKFCRASSSALLYAAHARSSQMQILQLAQPPKVLPQQETCSIASPELQQARTMPLTPTTRIWSTALLLPLRHLASGIGRYSISAHLVSSLAIPFRID